MSYTSTHTAETRSLDRELRYLLKRRKTMRARLEELDAAIYLISEKLNMQRDEVMRGMNTNTPKIELIH